MPLLGGLVVQLVVFATDGDAGEPELRRFVKSAGSHFFTM
jgi:hypothetical protein